MPELQQGHADIVIGTQYGDEGKARVIDDLAANYQIIARFNGGANAGHTVEANGMKFALRQVPSGVLHGQTTLYVGSGCVIDLEKLQQEIASIQSHGITLQGRLKLSSQASIVQPHHKLIDAIIGGKVGTTKNGIGPAYADRAIRMHGTRVTNIRLADLLDNPDHYFSLIEQNFLHAQQQYHFQDTDIADQITAMRQAFQEIKNYIEPDTLFLAKQAQSGAKILFEGAQSFMLDVNKGSIPYVTASSTAAAAAYNGGDLPPKFHRKTIGVVKAVMSRVGHGPFVSEMGGEKSEAYTMQINPDGTSVNSKQTEKDLPTSQLLASADQFQIGQAFRVLSNEYGTVTGRPRRVGHLDLMQLRYAVAANGIDQLVITKCDLLRHYSFTAQKQIPIVTGYTLDDQQIDYVPGSTDAYGRVKPIYQYLDCSDKDLSAITTYAALPDPIKKFIDTIEQFLKCQVKGLSVGPDRSQYIEKV